VKKLKNGNKTNAKLVLHREVIVQLTSLRLQRVAGGNQGTPFVENPTDIYECETTRSFTCDS